MAAFIAYLMSSLKDDNPLSFDHPAGLPMPPVIHQVLEDSYIQKFKEVFVIGDVHGCFDEMEALLEKADVLHDTTLKIFVGDLVNKGPKNIEVLQRLRNMPSTLSVRGNHDEIILQINLNLAPCPQNGRYEWIRSLSKEDVEYLIKLPYTISIPSLKAIIVHAGLVPGVPLDSNDLTDMITMRNLIVKDYFSDGEIQVTKCGTIGEPWGSLWPGTNHIYFGHNAKRRLQRFQYATCLDTGCVYGNKLTGLFISGPKQGTFVEIDAFKMHCSTKDR